MDDSRSSPQYFYKKNESSMAFAYGCFGLPQLSRFGFGFGASCLETFPAFKVRNNDDHLVFLARTHLKSLVIDQIAAMLNFLTHLSMSVVRCYCQPSGQSMIPFRQRLCGCPVTGSMCSLPITRSEPGRQCFRAETLIGVVLCPQTNPDLYPPTPPTIHPPFYQPF